ncbi:abc transporter g family member 53 [Quercus suber]|uniref:Abc transporter g family member 53 n=1 Tax=Quercus suber TaxID=58331 RepID=A0AAW0KNG3_QUESU
MAESEIARNANSKGPTSFFAETSSWQRIHYQQMKEYSTMMRACNRIPVWWRWYYWACPVAWTLYGLVVSQFGDIEELMNDGNNESVKEFVKSYFGYKHDFLGVVAVVVAGVAVLFAFIFAVSIKIFNFQRR